MRADLDALVSRWGLAQHIAGFGVWDLDIVAQQVHYSPEFKALLGYGGVDDVEPTAVWRARVHADDVPGMLQALNRHLAGTAPDYQHEFRLQDGHGGWRWVLSRGRVVERDAQGRPLRAVGTLTDLSERRQADLMRAQRDRAEADRRAMAALLSRMSHELRTPLNAVLGFAQLLAPRLGGADLQAQRRDLAHIEHAGWELLRLIEQMLQQAEAAGLQPDPAMGVRATGSLFPGTGPGTGRDDEQTPGCPAPSRPVS